MLHIVSLISKKRSVCSYYADYALSSITYFSNYLTFEFEESFFRVMAGDLLESFPISDLVLHRPLPAVSCRSFRFCRLNHTISIDRNSHTSSSDIYSIPFLSLFLLLLFYFPRCFLAIFPSPLFLLGRCARGRLCILSISLFLFLPPLLLSLLYVHV